MEFLNYVYVIVLLVSSVAALGIGPFIGRIQATTLWVGKKIAPEGTDEISPRGFQDAITPQFQNRLNILLFVCYFLVLVSGTLIKWYLGVPALIATMVFQSVTGRFYPTKLSFYLKIITEDMHRRIADYTRDGDQMRADAAKEVAENLKSVYVMALSEDFPVPEITKARQVKNGFVDTH